MFISRAKFNDKLLQTQACGSIIALWLAVRIIRCHYINIRTRNVEGAVTVNYRSLTAAIAGLQIG